MPKRLKWTTGSDTTEVDILYTDTPGADPDTLLATIPASPGEQTYDISEESQEGRRWAVRPVNAEPEPDVEGELSNVVQEPSSPVVEILVAGDAVVGEGYSAVASITDADGDLAEIGGTLNGIEADSVTAGGDGTYTFTWLAASLPPVGEGYALVITASDGVRSGFDSAVIEVIEAPDGVDGELIFSFAFEE